MKVTELMIGDFIYNSYRNLKVAGIYDDHCISSDGELVYNGDIEPIPLTPEILEKNGFVNGEFYSELLLHDDAGTQIQCDCDNLKIRTRERELLDIPCIFVHQLQHALRLLNIDIKIEL